MIKKINHFFMTERLEDKMFNIVLLFASILACICIVWNILINLPFNTNYKWFAIILFSIFALKYSEDKIISSWTRFIFFAIVVFVFVPNGWVNSGGNVSLTLAYVFLICISVSFLFSGFKRILLVFGLIALFLSLIIMEYINPNGVLQYDVHIQFYDALIQIPITLFFAFYFLRTIANAYQKEKVKLEQYSKELQIANEKLLELSRRDSLTKLYNKEYTFDYIKNIIEQCKKDKTTFCLLMMDIDNFKYVNDTFGHVVGDDILIKICEMLKNNFNEHSIVGRYGGDEFIVITTLKKKDAISRSEKLAKEIEMHTATQELKVTISGGLAQYTYEMELLDLVKEADKLLYTAKHAGKNKIYA